MPAQLLAPDSQPHNQASPTMPIMGSTGLCQPVAGSFPVSRRVSVQEMRKDHEEQLQRLKRLKDQEIDAVTSATSYTRY